MKEEERSEVEIKEIFEKCWKELSEEYGAKRLFNLYCSEADIQLHLASKLLEALEFPTCVYIEFPIPFKIEDFIIGRMNLGRPVRKMKKDKGMVADIVVMGAHELVPSIITEIKYNPLIWNYLPILKAVEGKVEKEQKEKVKKALQKEINRLASWEEYGPSQRLIWGYSKSVGKTIQIMQDFKERYEVSIHAYLCIIDELYPDLGQSLQEEIKQYRPPEEFKLKFQHYSVKSWLEEQLSKLR